MPIGFVLLDLPFETSEEVVIDTLLDALDDISGDGNEFIELDHQQTPTQTQTRFANETGDAIVSIWKDNESRLRHIEISVPSTERLNKATKALHKYFDIVDHREVLKRIAAAAADGELPDNIFYQLAYSATAQLEDATFQTIVQNLRSSVKSRRQGSAVAAGVVGWSAFKAPLRDALAAEPDDEIRTVMERVLSILR